MYLKTAKTEFSQQDLIDQSEYKLNIFLRKRNNFFILINQKLH